MIKSLLTATAVALVLTGSLHAQTSPAKKELVAKILQLQQPGLEALARNLVEQPAMQLMQQAGAALQRLPAERREAVAADIQADLRKYVEETYPLVREKAVKAGPLIAPALEERFTEDELKQIVSIMESPVLKRFQATVAETQRPVTEKTVADSRSVVEPKLKALQDGVAKRLGITPAPAGSASGGKK
jgi:hypothetical protein